jgi:hypothetical protein
MDNKPLAMPEEEQKTKFYIVKLKLLKLTILTSFDLVIKFLWRYKMHRALL